MDRQEYGLTFGLAFTDSFTGYLGWKWAETSFKQRLSGPFLYEDIYRIPGTWSQSYNYDFDYNGPFLGLGYSWTLSSGRILANFGVAFLSAEYKNIQASDVTIDLGPYGQIIAEDLTNGPAVTARAQRRASSLFNGDSTGVNFGVTWEGNTKWDNLTYRVALDGYQYNFGSGDRAGGDVTELTFNLFAGVRYAFSF